MTPTHVILVDGVGRCKVIEAASPRKQIIVWEGRSFVLSLNETLNDLPIYRLDGYPPAPIRWGR